MNSVDFLFEVVFHLVMTYTMSVDLLSNILKFLLDKVDKDGYENLFLNKRGEKMLLKGNSVVFEGLFLSCILPILLVSLADDYSLGFITESNQSRRCLRELRFIIEKRAYHCY